MDLCLPEEAGAMEEDPVLMDALLNLVLKDRQQWFLWLQLRGRLQDAQALPEPAECSRLASRCPHP